MNKMCNDKQYKIWEVVLIEEGLWESLEIDENAAWKDAVDMLHR